MIVEATAGVFQLIDLRFDTVQIFALSRDIASYTGIVKGAMLDTTGQVTNVSMIECGVLLKQSDEWKLIGGQSRNLDSPKFIFAIPT